MQAAGAVAAVVGITRDLVAEHQNADPATFADRAFPPMRPAPIDQLVEFGAGNDALIGSAPGFIMRGSDRESIRSSGRPNLD